MSESLFSVIRVVAMMLAVDSHIAAKERAWFMAVMNSFGATFKQRAVLRRHLNRSSSDSLEVIFRKINSEDQKRLVNFLKVAMNVDGVVSPSEKEFFEQINRLIEKGNYLSMDYTDLGHALLDRERDIELWKALSSFGKFLSIRRYGVVHSSYYPAEISAVSWDVLLEALLDKRYRLWIIAIIVGLLLTLILLAR